MLGADSYETDAERGDQLAEGKVPIGIGENTSIQYALIFTSSLIAHHIRHRRASLLTSNVYLLLYTENALLTRMRG